MKAILFPGQGSQYVGMGSTLYANFVEARETYEEANSILKFDIKKLSFEGPEEDLRKTKYTQPAILTHSIAVFRIIQNNSDFFKDLTTILTAGHSLGEFSSLVAINSLKFSDAVKLVHQRGIAMEEAGKNLDGTMVAIIGLNYLKVTEICEKFSTPDSCVIPANFNSETQTVISGHTSAVRKAAELAEKEHGAKIFPLAVSGPFHTPLLREASNKLREHLSTINIEKPIFPYYANIDAEKYGLSAFPNTIKDNLLRQVSAPVLWHLIAENMNNEGVKEVYEFGPGKVLSSLYKRFNRKVNIQTFDTFEDIKKYLNV